MTARWDNLFGEKPTTVVTPATPSVSAQPTAVETTAYTPWGREHTDVDEGVEVRLKTGEGQFVKHPFIMGFTWLGEGKFTLITSLGAMTFEGHHLAELRRRFRPTLVGVCGLRQPHEELYQVHRLECAGRLAPCQLVLEEVELTPTAAVKDDHRFAAPGLGAVALPQLSLTRLGAQHQPAEPGAQHSVRDGVS